MQKRPSLSEEEIEAVLCGSEELNRLYERCDGAPDFADEVARLEDLRHLLRATMAETPDTHPEAELLARYELSRASLDSKQREEIGAHLSVCGECRADLQGLRQFQFDKLPATEHRSLPTEEAATWLERAKRFAASVLPTRELRYASVSAGSFAFGVLLMFGVFAVRPADRGTPLRLVVEPDIRMRAPGGIEQEQTLTVWIGEDDDVTLPDSCVSGKLVCTCEEE